MLTKIARNTAARSARSSTRRLAPLVSRTITRGISSMHLAKRSASFRGVAKHLPMTYIPARQFSDAPGDLMRNIAIIAHVDHGKTTLVDGLLKQSLGMEESELDRVMDSNAIEQERGITIMSKVTSIKYDANSGKRYHINIVDTPGHADFGGEVERIMSMVDGVCLVVDASEGPMTQTKFVLDKALKRGLKPIVVINKVDRESARLDEVPGEIFDLFCDMGATDEQLEFPILYASGRDKWCTLEPGEKGKDLKDMYEMVVDHVPPPETRPEDPFTMLVTQIHSDPYLGRLLRGRISAGTVKVGDTIKSMDPESQTEETVRVTKILTTEGLQSVTLDSAGGGQIVSIAGCKKGTVNSTLCDPAVEASVEHIPIDPPTVAMTLSPNDGPLVGQEGNAATAAMIREWLLKEAETNISLTVKLNDSGVDGRQTAAQVFGRGELQLGIVLENMRRQGFELCAAAPQVVMTTDADGNVMEPMEEVVIETHKDYQGSIVDKLSERKADMVDMITTGDKTKLVFHCCTRGLIGYRSEFMNDTCGTGVINTIFHSYVPYRGEIERSIDKKGAMLSTSSGTTTAYAIEALQSRGSFFIGEGTKVYPGMVIGENSKVDDIEVNPVRSKQLTNIRTVNKDAKTVLIPPVVKTLEQYIADLRDDEMVEVTTKSIRLRKMTLDANERKRKKQQKKKLLLEENLLK